MKIEIETSQVERRTFPDKNDSSKQNVMYNQSGYMHKSGKKYPEEFNFTVDTDPHGQPLPLAAGVYNVDPEKLVVIGKYKSIDVAKFDVYQIIKASPYKSLADLQASKDKKVA